MGVAAKGSAAAAAVALVTIAFSGAWAAPARHGLTSTSTPAQRATAPQAATQAGTTPSAGRVTAAAARPATARPATKKTSKKATTAKKRTKKPVKKTVAKKPQVVRLSAWESQVLSGVQKARTGKKVRVMRGNACLKTTAMAMAQRLATTPTASRTTDWTPADTTRLLRCAPASKKIHADAAWEANARTPAAWVSTNIVSDKRHVNAAWREVGVGAYRDRNGRAHVVLLQMYVTAR